MTARQAAWLIASGLLIALVISIPSLHKLTGRTMIERVAAQSTDRALAAEERVKPLLERDLEKLGSHFGAPVFMRIFKREKELELWVKSDSGNYRLFRAYPICTWSGDLGPKLREGDKQSPEGFYRVGAGQLNPQSSYHLSFNLGYPNAYDRAHARSGNFLMVHGSCVSIGCYAMGDDGIEEIYTLAAAALRNGQRQFEVHAFPFRLEQTSLDAESASPWHGFWSELKPAYDGFERTRRPPRIEVRGRHYAVTEV